VEKGELGQWQTAVIKQRVVVQFRFFAGRVQILGLDWIQHPCNDPTSRLSPPPSAIRHSRHPGDTCTKPPFPVCGCLWYSARLDCQGVAAAGRLAVARSIAVHVDVVAVHRAHNSSRIRCANRPILCRMRQRPLLSAAMAPGSNTKPVRLLKRQAFPCPIHECTMRRWHSRSRSSPVQAASRSSFSRGNRGIIRHAFASVIGSTNRRDTIRLARRSRNKFDEVLVRSKP
jgi:hypothetical protein